ncbi:MAG: hypothetical protein J6X27_05365 [Bacteroidaceae bacterium]|nr:hypothetical protein [Bacteroidaceae bacterium]
MIALCVTTGAQTEETTVNFGEQLPKFAERITKLQNLVDNQPKVCGVMNIDKYAEAVKDAALFAIANSQQLRTMYYREIGKTEDGVTDVNVKKPTLEEWVSLGTTIAGEGAKVAEATKSAKAAADEAKQIAEQVKAEKNPMKAAKLGKQAKAATALVTFGNDALVILGEETVEQGKAINSIIETLNSGKNL